MSLSDYEKISIIKMLENPPKEPDMTKLAPVMNSLFPEITKKIKDAYVNETDVTEWTREANELLIKQKVEDQVRVCGNDTHICCQIAPDFLSGLSDLTIVEQDSEGSHNILLGNQSGNGCNGRLPVSPSQWNKDPGNASSDSGQNTIVDLLIRQHAELSIHYTKVGGKPDNDGG